MYGYPDIGTQLVLGLRTIVTTVPVLRIRADHHQLTGALQGIADQDIFLISPLAKIAIVPVQFVGDIAYVATNFAAPDYCRAHRCHRRQHLPAVATGPAVVPVDTGRRRRRRMPTCWFAGMPVDRARCRGAVSNAIAVLNVRAAWNPGSRSRAQSGIRRRWWRCGRGRNGSRFQFRSPPSNSARRFPGRSPASR